MATTKDYKDMTEEEKEEYWQSVFRKIADIHERAKYTAIKGLKVTLTSGGRNSLEEVVNVHEKDTSHAYNSLSENMKTKEQADLFKKLIKAL